VKLTASTAHRLVVDGPDRSNLRRWLLALAFFRLGLQRAEQMRLKLDKGGRAA